MLLRPVSLCLINGELVFLKGLGACYVTWTRVRVSGAGMYLGIGFNYFSFQRHGGHGKIFKFVSLFCVFSYVKWCFKVQRISWIIREVYAYFHNKLKLELGFL